MKKSTFLFSAALVVIVASSFSQANSNRLEDLNNDITSNKNQSISIKDLRGYKNNIIIGTSATAMPGTLDNLATTDSSTGYFVSGPGTGTGTGTGKNTKLENLINHYK
ncbi:hypothetical protein WH221_07250 [Chryseobacterium culicis]|uniref:Uncharacterized protein n=1 Tax=Chryseobacterium culicis TaxID=680127 RepID=A0A2S9CZU8_CHRCI|nr:hypothetical protein [Chryseobacterium culicis]PRB86035.1 hypothetical protein CQ022_07230 [Chryseobacterium culicis]PRB91788.1 hypothetical protein CQ033_00900 [Chryseobacterium culicis]